MSLYPPPQRLEARIFSKVPDELRRPDAQPEWAIYNRPDRRADVFLEGPSFDREGNLWMVDVPHGRILVLTADGIWRVRCEYDGWPNGLKIHHDGRIFIADYKHGILVLDPRDENPRPLLTHRHSERFRGCNDLIFSSAGKLFFTDQGQSGMHMPNGRVYAYDLGSSHLTLLLDCAPSPNGIVLSADERILYVAMTRANAIWRLPLMDDGAVSKAGVFIQLSGGMGGPDGLALDEDGGLYVAHVGNGCVWGFNQLGHPAFHIARPGGSLGVTNIAFGGPDNTQLFILESDTGNVLVADLPKPGHRLYSHR